MTELSREQMLAEGRKQADIHGVDMDCARVYAEGWAAAMARADRAIEEAQRAADKSLWDANFNAGLVYKGRIEELERQLRFQKMLERQGHQAAARAETDRDKESARLASAKAHIARLNAFGSKRYADLLDQVTVLQERIAKALECLDGLDELGAVLAAQTPNYPSVTSVSSTVIRNLLTGAVLDGESEKTDV